MAMLPFRAALTFGLINLVGAQSTAQQVVQLPTFSFFSVSTSVSVPDSGGAYQGGFNRARYGQNAAGLPATPAARAIAHGLQAGQSSVSATIIDHKELDPARTHSGLGIASPDNSPEARRFAEARRSSAGSVPGSVADAERLRTAELLIKQDEAKQLVEQAKSAEASGKPAVARIYYSSAAKRAEGALRDEALAGLRRMQGAKVK
ncbi:MAG: hypothetical protein HY000_29855 [Planctomycetes bacterium]|nr:hypothetical protein [Planctomycetota bacterium]